MKAFSFKSLTLAAMLAIGTNAQADCTLIASLGGGVAFGFGDNVGNGPLIDAEFGYEWDAGDGVATALVLAADYASVDYLSSGPRGRTIRGSEDILTLAPRVRVSFPVDEIIGFYIQGQAGVNFSDGILSEFGWGAGAGLDFRFSKACSLRVGYQAIGDFESNGYHGALAAVSYKF
jgi:opacity protein-like surface antigen